jgi:hypothetical protein
MTLHHAQRLAVADPITTARTYGQALAQQHNCRPASALAAACRLLQLDPHQRAEAQAVA